MGLIHSGDVADVCLANSMESWATDLRVKWQHRVWVYMRFKYDILIVYTCRDLLAQFFDGMCSRADYFRLVFDDVESVRLHWLQIIVIVAGVRPIAKPAFKTTMSTAPLSESSGHAAHTRRSWPISMLRSLLPLCSTPVHAREARTHF